MPTLKNISPIGHIDVPLIGREGGPVAYYECPDGDRCVEVNGPDHEHELVKPEGSGAGSGCLIPGEEFEVSDDHAKALLEHPDNFTVVKTAKKTADSTEKKDD